MSIGSNDWTNPPPPGIDEESSGPSAPKTRRDQPGGDRSRSTSRSHSRSKRNARDYRSRSREYRRHRSRSRSRHGRHRRHRRSRSRDRRRHRTRSSSRSRSRSVSPGYRSHRRRHHRRSRSKSYSSASTGSEREHRHRRRPRREDKPRKYDEFHNISHEADEMEDDDDDTDAVQENSFKNDGTFLEMFKKMQEEQAAVEAAKKAETTTEPSIGQPKTQALYGKRRGGRVLKTGMVQKLKSSHEKEDEPRDAWSVYMKEVRKYKEACCDDDSKTRPLVK